MVGVEDLDPAGVLARLADAERRDREVQREKLDLAYRWCVQHPATIESGTATWGDAGLPGLSDCDASLGGDGTPGVAPFVAEELGAAMGMSTQSAMALMADALDLRHRFPLLWAKVEAGEVAPWKTRRVAADTRSLPFEAARWVDAELAEGDLPRRPAHTNLYVHVSLFDLATHAVGSPVVGEVEKLGPAPRRPALRLPVVRQGRTVDGSRPHRSLRATR